MRAASSAPRELIRRAPDETAGMAPPVLTTTVVGSYPQPDWLVDRAMLSA